MQKLRNLVCTTGLLASLAGGCGAWGGPTHHIVFEQNAGLMVGDEVRMAGIVVGEVVSIRLDGAHDANIGIRVDAGTPLYADASAWIDPNNAFGPHHIVLFSGAANEPLAHGAKIPEAHISYDVPDMLRSFEVAQDDGPSLVPGAINSLQTANYFLRSLAPLDQKVDLDDKVGKVDEVIDRVNAWGEENFPWLQEKAEGAALWMLEQRVKVSLTSFDKSLANAENTLLPRLMELDRKLDAAHAKLDTALARTSDLDRDMQSALEALKDVRELVKDYEEIDKSTIRSVRQTTAMLQRLNRITESDIRMFFQVEGIRSTVAGMSLDAAEAVAEKTNQPKRDWSEW